MECEKSSTLPSLSALVAVTKFTDNIRQVTNLLFNLWNTLLEICSLSSSQLHRYPIYHGTNWLSFSLLSCWYCSKMTHILNNNIFKSFDCLLNRKRVDKAYLFLSLFSVNILSLSPYLHWCCKICNNTSILDCDTWFFVNKVAEILECMGFFC